VEEKQWSDRFVEVMQLS